MSPKSTEVPWYADGLAFECTRCGACCTGDPGFVWVTEEELAAIAHFLGRPLREVRDLHARKSRGRITLREKANGDCVFFDRQKGCTIYPGPPAAVPHLAVLGQQRRDARRLGPDLPRLPRFRDGRGHPGRGDHAAIEGHQDVTAPRENK